MRIADPSPVHLSSRVHAGVSLLLSYSGPLYQRIDYQEESERGTTTCTKK